MAQRTPSWFTDPQDPRLARWHDGRDWTSFTMVVAEWTSPEPPPPPAGWSPEPSPTAGLVPAFGATAPPAPVAPAPAPAPVGDPEPPRAAATPTTTQAAAPGPAPTPAAPAPGPAAPSPPAPAAAEPAPPAPTPTTDRPRSEPPEEPRGLARLAELAGDRPPASGVRIAAPVAVPEPEPTPAFAAPAAPAEPTTPQRDEAPTAAPATPAAPPTPGAEPSSAPPDPAPAPEIDPEIPTGDPGFDSGPVPIFDDAPPVAPAPTRPAPTPAFEDPDRRAPRTGQVPVVAPGPDDDELSLGHGGHGPEAPGVDWGGGAEAPRPSRRPSGWSDDPDSLTDLPVVRRSLLDRYRWSPVWVRIGLPLVVVAVVALVALQLAGGGDDDGGGTANPFGNGDGTLEEATANEPGMGDAVAAARDAGVPEAISDQELATLVKGVCSAARRSLVPLNLSESLAASGVEAGTLETAATALGTGALEFCPDQSNTIPQVVSVLVARTERMLGTAG